MVAYELDIPSESEGVHLMFHVCMWQKIIKNVSKIMRVKYICVFKDFSYGVVLVSMFDCYVRKNSTKEVVLVKVLWWNNNVEEIT